MHLCVICVGIAALLATSGSSLVSLKRRLIDADYRKEFLRKIDDPIVQSFRHDFEQLDSREKHQDTVNTLNQADAYLLEPTVRNALARKRNKLSFSRITVIDLPELGRKTPA